MDYAAIEMEKKHDRDHINRLRYSLRVMAKMLLTFRNRGYPDACAKDLVLSSNFEEVVEAAKDITDSG